MFTADQTHSLAHGWGLSYGVKGQFTSNKSYQNTLDKEGNILPNATSSVDINERIWNIYAGFSKQINKAISLEASVAAEQYHSPDMGQMAHISFTQRPVEYQRESFTQLVVQL